MGRARSLSQRSNGWTQAPWNQRGGAPGAQTTVDYCRHSYNIPRQVPKGHHALWQWHWHIHTHRCWQGHLENRISLDFHHEYSFMNNETMEHTTEVRSVVKKNYKICREVDRTEHYTKWNNAALKNRRLLYAFSHYKPQIQIFRFLCLGWCDLCGGQKGTIW